MSISWKKPQETEEMRTQWKVSEKEQCADRKRNSDKPRKKKEKQREKDAREADKEGGKDKNDWEIGREIEKDVRWRR